MAEMRDRRSSNNGKQPESVPANEPAPERRRSPFMAYFAVEARLHSVKRGEFLGILEMIEYSRRESVWYRRVWRWLHSRPGPGNLPRSLANAHYHRTIKPMLDQITAELEAKARAENAAGGPPHE